jgi:hypothetical protein
MGTKQKSFRPENAECSEYGCNVNMIIDDVTKFGKEIYVVRLAFNDAFGSILHFLLQYTLENTELNKHDKSNSIII